MPPDELRQFHNLTDRQSRLIATAFEMGHRMRQNAEPKAVISCPQDAANLLAPRMNKLLQEELHALLLNTRNQVVAERTIYIGTVNSSSVRPAEVIRPAVMLNAPNMIIAHNHPSGDPTPSPEDASVTRDIVAAANLMDIKILDHIVIGEGYRFTSMKERGLGFDS